MNLPQLPFATSSAATSLSASPIPRPSHSNSSSSSNGEQFKRLRIVKVFKLLSPVFPVHWSLYFNIWLNSAWILVGLPRILDRVCCLLDATSGGTHAWTCRVSDASIYQQIQEVTAKSCHCQSSRHCKRVIANVVLFFYSFYICQLKFFYKVEISLISYMNTLQYNLYRAIKINALVSLEELVLALMTCIF